MPNILRNCQTKFVHDRSRNLFLWCVCWWASDDSIIHTVVINLSQSSQYLSISVLKRHLWEFGMENTNQIVNLWVYTVTFLLGVDVFILFDTWWICSIVMFPDVSNLISVTASEGMSTDWDLSSCGRPKSLFLYLSYFLLFFHICYLMGVLLISFFHGWHLFPLMRFWVHLPLHFVYFMPSSHFLTTFLLQNLPCHSCPVFYTLSLFLLCLYSLSMHIAFSVTHGKYFFFPRL